MYWGDGAKAAEIDLGGGYSIDLDDAQKFINALQDQKARLGGR